MEKKYLYVFSFLTSIFFLIDIASAVPPVCDWRGYAYINSSAVGTNHVVTSYTNDSQATNATIFSSGYYILPVPGNIGDNVTFKICGVYTNATAQTWGCGGVGYNTLNLYINTSANGAACTYACGCSGGYCNSGVCAASAPTTSSTTTTTGGGGGGGGGGTTTVAATTTVATTTTIGVTETGTVAQIEAGSSATVEITQEDTLKVESVTIEVKNTVSNVGVIVKESSLPTGANVAIAADTGAVYKYLEITKTNVQDADINKVKIKFKVEKSWVTTNNMDPSTIALQRLVGSDWTKLSTTQTSEDATYYYFEAESPGLSVFAITSQKKAVATTAATTAATTTAPVTPPVLPPTLMYLFLGILLIAAAVIFFVRKAKKPFKIPTGF